MHKIHCNGNDGSTTLTKMKNTYARKVQDVNEGFKDCA